MAVSPARAIRGPLEGPATRLLGVSAEACEAGTCIRLHTDGAPGEVAVFVLQDPPRLVIDLFDLRDAETPARIPVGGSQVSQLRVGTHPEMVRIVADAGSEPSSLEQVATEMRPDGLVVRVGLPRGDGAPDRLLAVPSVLPTRGASGALAGPAAPSQPPAHGIETPLGRPATQLLGVSAEACEAGTCIRLHTDGAPGEVAVFVLQDPPRLVIDLFDLRDAETPARIPVGGSQVSQLRVGTHPEMIRIVADAGSEPSSLERVATEMRPDGLVVEVGLPRDDEAPDRLLAVSPVPPPRGASGASAAPGPLPAQAGVSEPPKATSDGLHVELKADRSRVGRSLPRGMRAVRSWTSAFDFDWGSPSGRGDGASDGERHEPASERGWNGQGLATLADWEPDTLAHNRIRLGFLDDRIRLTARYARSRYDASARRFATLGSLHGRDLDRLLAPAGVDGEAFSGRLEGTLWRWGPAGIDAFASYQRVDPLFAWSGSDEKDPFAKSDRRMLEAGGRIRSGPFGLELSRISEQADVDDSRSAPPRRWSNRAVLSASLDPLRQLDAGASEHGLWSLAPDSAWVSLSQGRVESDGSRREDAATRGLSAGLSWDGETSSATLGLWRWSYEDGGAALDWTGSGADLSYGIYGERWSLYAGLGAQRYLTDQPGYRSVESSVAGFASFSVRPKHLPGLTGTFHLDLYQADYGASAVPLQTDSWGFRTGLDLADFLFPIQRGFRPPLRAAYGAVWSRARYGSADPQLALDHGPIVDFGIDF